MIVSDSGPIIAFSKIDRLDILRLLFGRVLIPDAVYDEIVVRGMGRPGSDDVARSSWIERRTLMNVAVMRELPQRIHAGEREAIALAYELGMPLLIDERRGRQAAYNIGVVIIGSLGVLAEARREEIVEDLAPLVRTILDSGYWISPEVVTDFLELTQ